MPDGVSRLLQSEVRRQGSDLNTLIRDLICTVLTERAKPIRRMKAEGENSARQ